MRALMNYLERRRIEMTLAHVKGRLLDIGCGNNRLVRTYGNGIGVDVYPWEGVDLVVQDSAKLPFPDKSFDTVSFVACLNHIPNRREVLREARRVLTDDGVVLATMIPPRISRLWHLVNAPWDTDQSERGMQPGEVYGLTSRQMRRLFAETGFELIEQHRFILWLNSLYVARKRTSPDRQENRSDES